MAMFNGLVVLQVKDMDVNSEEELRDALQRTVSVIANEATKFNGMPKETTVSGGAAVDHQGRITSGTVTVTTSGNSGTVTASGTVNGAGQPTGGTVTGSWSF